MNVYFDNAATTPISKKVLDKMIPYMEDGFGNPSSIHKRGREIKSVIEKSRSKVADILSCEPGEIFFTSGGTEADNMFIINTVLEKKIDTIEKPSPKLKDKIIRSLTYKGWEIDKVIKIVNQLTK